MALGCSGQTGKGPVCHTLGAGACPCISLPAGLAALQRFPIAFGTFSVTLGCGGAFLLSRAAGIEQSCTLHRAWDTVALAQHQCSRDRVPGEGTELCLLMGVWREDKDPLVPWSSKPTPVSCPSAGGGVFVSRRGCPCCRGLRAGQRQRQSPRWALPAPARGEIGCLEVGPGWDVLVPSCLWLQKQLEDGLEGGAEQGGGVWGQGGCSEPSLALLSTAGALTFTAEVPSHHQGAAATV